MITDDRIVVTLRDIAEAAGISVDGARRRAKRRDRDGLWRILPSNHPQDPLRIDMPRQDLDDLDRRDSDVSGRQGLNVRSVSGDGRQETDGLDHPDTDDSARQALDVLRERISELQLDLVRERTERLTERERSGRLAEQLIIAEREKAEIERTKSEIEKVAAVRESDIIYRDATIEDLRITLNEMRDRRWWQRLVG